MVSRARSRAVAHDTVFRGLIAIMTLETIFHKAPDVMPVEVFPGGDAGVTTTALCLGMLFMGKTERFLVALTFALGMPGLFHVAETAVGFFSRLKMAVETAIFAGSAKSVIDFRLLSHNAASTGIYRRCAPQRLPTGRQTGHAFRFVHFTVDMAGATAD